MADSSPNLGLQYHVRSISLPSQLPPHSIKIEDELNKLKNWETTLVSTTNPFTAETIQIGVLGVAELYNCVEELFHSPLTQQALLQPALLQPQHGMLVEEALEGSVGLLDSCGTARDMFVMMKENVRDLQSALRRKGGDSSIESNIIAYMCFRKKMKKDVTKCLKALKQKENKIRSCYVLDADHYPMMVMRVLREVTTITISVFQSLLLFLSASSSNTKPGGWSLISKLMLTRSEASERGQRICNEVGSVDFALQSLHGSIQSNDAKVDLQMAQRRLQTLDAGIECLEAGLDCLSRRLIQNRVSLLNILTH